MDYRSVWLELLIGHWAYFRFEDNDLVNAVTYYVV